MCLVLKRGDTRQPPAVAQREDHVVHLQRQTDSALNGAFSETEASSVRAVLTGIERAR